MEPEKHLEKQLLDLGVKQEELGNLKNVIIVASKYHFRICENCQALHKFRIWQRKCSVCKESYCDRCGDFIRCNSCDNSYGIVCRDCQVTCKAGGCTTRLCPNHNKCHGGCGKDLCNDCCAHVCRNKPHFGFCKDCFVEHRVECPYDSHETDPDFISFQEICDEMCTECAKCCDTCNAKACKTHSKQFTNVCVQCKKESKGCAKCKLVLWCSEACKGKVIERLQDLN